MRRIVLCMCLLACGGAAPAQSVTMSPAQTKTPTQTQTQTQTEALTLTPTLTQSSGPAVTSLPGTAIHFEGGDGSTVDHAIVIRGAKGEADGVAAEYKYLDLAYGPHKVGSQSLLNQNGHSFDRLDVDAHGKSIAVFFDISDYFGKF